METKHAAGPRRKSVLTGSQSVYAEADRAICERGNYYSSQTPETSPRRR